MNQLKPLHDYVFVKPDPKTKKVGQIELPAEYQDAQRVVIGTVLEVGPGKVYPSGVRVDMQVQVGDRVLYNEYAPADIIQDEVVAMLESDIVCVGDETSLPVGKGPQYEG